MYQSRTLRRMRPETRKLAKLANEMEVTLKRVKRFLETVEELEMYAEPVVRSLKRGGPIEIDRPWTEGGEPESELRVKPFR